MERRSTSRRVVFLHQDMWSCLGFRRRGRFPRTSLSSFSVCASWLATLVSCSLSCPTRWPRRPALRGPGLSPLQAPLMRAGYRRRRAGPQAARPLLRARRSWPLRGRTAPEAGSTRATQVWVCFLFRAVSIQHYFSRTRSFGRQSPVSSLAASMNEVSTAFQSPTTPYADSLKMLASGSRLMDTMRRAPEQPAMCWLAPDTPIAM